MRRKILRVYGGGFIFNKASEISSLFIFIFKLFIFYFYVKTNPRSTHNQYQCSMKFK